MTISSFSSNIAQNIVYYSRHFRLFQIFLATIFSVGKISQTAGLNVIGITAIFTKFPTNIDYLPIVVTIICVIADILTTSATRVPKIYEFFLNSKFHFADVYLVNEYPLPQAVNLSNGYILCSENITLHKITTSTVEAEEIPLNIANKHKLDTLLRDLSQQLLLGTDTNSFPDEQPYRFISDRLSDQQVEWLHEVTQPAYIPSYDTTTATVVHHFCYTMSQLSVPISFIQAYLSGINFVEFIFQTELDITAQYGIGVSIGLSATLSYVLFNLPKMRDGVTAFAKGLDNILTQRKSIGIPNKTIVITLLTVTAGIIAYFGLSYLLMKQIVFCTFPITQIWPSKFKESIVMCCAIISLFAGTFSLAYSSYELIKKSFQDCHPSSAPQYPSYAIVIAFCDSVGTTSGGFIGILLLNETYLNVGHGRYSTAALFAFSIYCYLSNVLMYFSLAMVDSMNTITAINEFISKLGDNCHSYYQQIPEHDCGIGI